MESPVNCQSVVIVLMDLRLFYEPPTITYEGQSGILWRERGLADVP